MNKFLVLTLTAVLLGMASAHLTMICSSTDPAKAGQIDFYFGTYHGKGNAPGTVTISQPTVTNGASLSGSFTNQFAASNFKFTDVASVKANLIKSKALTSDKALVSCYVENAASGQMTPPKDGQWILPAGSKDNLKCAGGSYEKINMWSKLTIKNAKSGNWRLSITGTNDVYNPHQKQCSLSKNNPKWIGGMTVADGAPACKGTAPVGTGFDMASVKKCSTTSGAQCAFKCESDKAKKEGVIECRKGTWHVTAKCVSETTCAKEAENHIDSIKSSVNTCQATVNGLTNGAHCPKESAGIVDAAKKSAKTADTNAKNAASALSTAEKTPVAFSAVPLDKIDSSTCPQLFSHMKANSNYNAAKSALDSAKTANTNAAAAKVAADKAVTDALAAQAKAIMKCKCSASRHMDSAYDKCTQNAASEKKMWDKAHHIDCVQKGTMTLDASHASTGSCKVPKCPTITKKKMAYPVTEAECKKAGVEIDADEAMDAAFEASVEEMDLEQVSMPGWHHMEDGSMMKDSDM